MKYAVYSRETMKESILSDAVTALMLIGAISFSHYMQTPLWTIACFIMLGVSLTVKLPMETDREFKFGSKKEAINWANNLPDDDIPL